MFGHDTSVRFVELSPTTVRGGAVGAVSAQTPSDITFAVGEEHCTEMSTMLIRSTSLSPHPVIVYVKGIPKGKLYSRFVIGPPEEIFATKTLKDEVVAQIPSPHQQSLKVPLEPRKTPPQREMFAVPLVLDAPATPSTTAGDIGALPHCEFAEMIIILSLSLIR